MRLRACVAWRGANQWVRTIDAGRPAMHQVAFQLLAGPSS
jgi:hypothetical protein